MKVSLVAASLVLYASSAAYAANPSNASLKGTYAFQSSKVYEVGWGKTVSITCSGVTYMVTLGGQAVTNQVIAGTVTFSGTGTMTISATEYGNFDQTESNNSVSIACTGNSKAPYAINNGSAMFDAAVPVTASGTYTVNSTGTGTLTIVDNGTETSNISLGQYNASGVATSVLLLDSSKGQGKVATGIAILE
jgi:hypothetical protein